jgi:hypothetical protein
MNMIKNIRTIAPFLADDFVDLDESIFDTEEYARFLNQNSDRLGIFKKYSFCKLHDSWIIGIKTEKDRFEITLNDFTTFVFANTIIEKYKLPIDPEKISFPLTIEFDEKIEVEYNSVDENGDLRKIDPIDLDEYLYEQITRLDKDCVEIVFQLWKSNLKEDIPGEDIIVIVSGKDLTINENQDKAWNVTFGHDYDKIYDYFKAQFNSDRYVSDQNECEKLIEEFENMTNK